MCETEKKTTIPSYELLAINHAYNQGKLTFKQWLELTRQWAEKVHQEYGAEKEKPSERRQ
jgi:hypothetical protein